MAQGVVYVDPTNDLTPASPTDADWNTIDLGASGENVLDGNDGDVVGVFLQLFGASKADFGLRRGDSTTDFRFEGGYDDDYRTLCVGLDTTDDTFDIYLTSWVSITRLVCVGYVLSAGGYFFQDPVELGPNTSIDTFQSIATLDGATLQAGHAQGGDTIGFPLCNFCCNDTANNFGMRPAGSSNTTEYAGLMMYGSGLSSGDVEILSGDITGADTRGKHRLFGYLKAAYVTAADTATDYSEATTFESYVDVDVSAQVTETSNGVFGWIHSNGSTRSGWLRSNGATADYYSRSNVDPKQHNFTFVGIDGSEIFEQNVENSFVDLYVLAFVKDGGAAGGLSIPVAMAQYRQRWR